MKISVNTEYTSQLVDFIMNSQFNYLLYTLLRLISRKKLKLDKPTIYVIQIQRLSPRYFVLLIFTNKNILLMLNTNN